MPGDWASWCAQYLPQGGSGPNFDSWGWGPCPSNPNVSQGVAADVNADVPPPSPPPAVVSASALASGARSSAQAYGTPAWVASMVALAATNTPQAAIAKANLAAFNAANPPVVASFRPKLALNIAPSHPLMALAKAPPIGVSASASPTETIAVLALAALGFVAWRKGWI